MPLVPSHDGLLPQKTTGNTRRAIRPYRPSRLVRPIQRISLTAPEILSIRLSPSTTARCSDYSSIHLLAGCDRLTDPPARTTGRYL
jgi:hypothetical protein